MEFTIENAFNLRDLVLPELFKIILVCYIKKLRLKFKCDTLYIKHKKGSILLYLFLFLAV